MPAWAGWSAYLAPGLLNKKPGAPCSWRQNIDFWSSLACWGVCALHVSFNEPLLPRVAVSTQYSIWRNVLTNHSLSLYTWVFTCNKVDVVPWNCLWSDSSLCPLPAHGYFCLASGYPSIHWDDSRKSNFLFITWMCNDLWPFGIWQRVWYSWALFLVFERPLHWFLKQLHQLIFLPTVDKSRTFPVSTPALVIICFLESKFNYGAGVWNGSAGHGACS